MGARYGMRGVGTLLLRYTLSSFRAYCSCCTWADTSLRGSATCYTVLAGWWAFVGFRGRVRACVGVRAAVCEREVRASRTVRRRGHATAHDAAGIAHDAAGKGGGLEMKAVRAQCEPAGLGVIIGRLAGCGDTCWCWVLGAGCWVLGAGCW
eukprot:2087277-Rhodomonas_salina.7